MKHKL